MKTTSFKKMLVLQKPGTPGTIRNKATWIDSGFFMGSIEPVTGTESDLNQGTISHIIRTHYRKGIDNTCQLLHGDRVFQIASAINSGDRNRELVISCTEVIGKTGSQNVTGTGGVNLK